jgi:AcrR family transcriptional regulator
MRTRPPSYHHGNLRQALMDEAVAMSHEYGHEAWSLRELARRLGVSSGAPFRHFADRAALMAAIAEEATLKLRLRVARDQHRAGAQPAARLKALGHSFIDWALDQPAQFRIVSDRRLFNFDQSGSLQVHFHAVRELTMQLVKQAQACGQLPRTASTQDLALTLRATAYGLVRMHIDGQLPQWQVKPAQARKHLRHALDLCVDAMVTAPGD